MHEAGSDDALVDRIKGKDPDAWEVVYRDLYPRLRAFAARRVGDQQAGDIVAETMTRAVASIHRFDPSGVGLSAWVFGICRHVVADSHRATARQRRRPAPPDQGPAHLDDGVEQNEESTAMRSAYGRLSEQDRELLDLRVIAGLSADEVAAVLGRRAGAVRMAQSRALGRLRAHFDEVYR